MRKIETDMVQAIRTGQQFKSGNTQVLHTGPSLTEVYLHGNLIARRDTADALCPGWRCTLAGWNTPTTRSRINAIAREFCHSGVWTKNGQAFSGSAAAPFAVSDTVWF